MDLFIYSDRIRNKKKLQLAGALRQSQSNQTRKEMGL